MLIKVGHDSINQKHYIIVKCIGLRGPPGLDFCGVIKILKKGMLLFVLAYQKHQLLNIV